MARAPGALRRAGLVERLPGSGVRDEGDVRFQAPTPERDADSGLIAPDAIVSMIEGVEQAVGRTVTEDRFPLVLGGDCPVLLGCLAAVRGALGNPGLLFVDGHEDAWPPLASTTGEAADMELGIALGLETSGLPRPLTERLPLVRSGDVVMLGPRDADELLRSRIGSLRGRVEIHDDTAVRAAGPGRLARAAAERLLRRTGTWWLHVDLDVLSTAAFPPIDYPQPGGLSWDELHDLTVAALAVPGLAGWDVTIYNPDLDPDGRYADRIVEYLAACLP